MDDNLKIANSPVFWALCAITVFVSLVQTLLFMRQAKKTADLAAIPPTVTHQAFKTGLVSAIGPACGVFVVMVGLMAAIGGPVAWMRLSIIGSAATELTTASYGAKAGGVAFGGEGYTLTLMAVSWFVMALNGAGWLVVTGLFTPSLEKLRTKVSGGDAKWLAALSGACTLGIFGNSIVDEIAKGWGGTIASLAGAVTMVFVMKLIVPKHSKLAEHSLAISMIAGMVCAILYDMYLA